MRVHFALQLHHCSRIFLVICVLATTAVTHGYYLPGAYPQEFHHGEKLTADVNSLTSSEAELPYNYYNLPYCKPEGGATKVSKYVNPGTLLMGLRVETSPYTFYVMVDETAKLVCKAEGQRGSYGPLSKDEAANLVDKIRDKYRVRLILDNLPVTTFDLERTPESVRPGFDVGFEADGKYYVNNHLMFRILVHPSHGQYQRMQQEMQEMEATALVEGAGRRLLSEVQRSARLLEETEFASFAMEDDNIDPDFLGPPHLYMVVGFEVIACSIKRTPGEKPDQLPCPMEDNDVQPQEVYEGVDIVYTYDVQWEQSDIQWVNRWDAYLQMPGGKVHWFSILNSLMVILVMTCIVAMILLRTIRRDLARYEQLVVESGGATDMEESGWKMISGDVFRAPKQPIALCVHVGSGVQILIASTVTLLFAAMGFLSPASRGALLTSLLVMYLLLAVAAGFSAVWLWGFVNRSYEGWHRVCLRVAFFFPGISLLVLSVLNLLIRHTGSSGAIPLITFSIMLVIWFLTTVPLAFSGGLLASKQSVVEQPTRTNQIPRHIPSPSLTANPIMLFLAAGLLPFGALFVELYFAMSSIWEGYFYYIFGFLFLVGMFTLVIVVEVAVICTYVQLCAEDYLWWWRSFHRGGSVALYVMLYAVCFLIGTLHDLNGFVSVFVYIVYMTLLCWGLYLSFGCVGFASSMFFAYKIFGSVKAD